MSFYDDHELTIARCLFWYCVIGVLGWTAPNTLIAILGDRWWAAAGHLAGSVILSAIALSTADDIRAYKDSLDLPLRPAWVERLRRWWHIALWGWSA